MKPFLWQADSWDALETRLQTGKIPHAMLFSGAQGIGKLNFATAFVYRLFCHDVQDGLACGVCDACHLLSIGNHPDLYQVTTLEGKQVISVDQIRHLISNVNLKPHSAVKKIAIIQGAELMNVNASNSLLKTLEEPPESCLLILITHRPDKLLPTIRSRCQVLEFTLPDQTHALNWLRANIEDTRQAEKLLALAGGAPLQAVKYAKNGTLQHRDELFTLLKAVLSGKQNPVTAAGLWFKKDLDVTLYCMTSWLTDMIRLKASSEPPVLVNPDLKSELLKLSEYSSLDKMLKFYDHLNTMHFWKKGNINAQAILEEILMHWSQLNQHKVA